MPTAALARNHGAGPPPGWSLTLLGGFHIRDPDGDPRSLRPRDQRLISYLALAGTAPRIVAAEALWPESSQEHALSSLRTAVRQVRTSCPGLLDARRDQMALAEETSVDVHVLRAESPALDPHDLLALPELLPGWYDDWVLFDRERFRVQRLLLLDEHAHRALACEDTNLALALAELAVELDPLRESAQRTLIEVHLAMGNRVEALRTYRDFRTRSLREFGVEPSPQMESLVSGLRAEQSNHQPPRRNGPRSRPR